MKAHAIQSGVIRFQTSVRIQRAATDVFHYVADPRNFSEWNSAVEQVSPTSAELDKVGASYTMQRRLPGGRATNRLEIVQHERPCEFGVRASAGPTPFLYRFRFSEPNGQTLVCLDAEVELGGPVAMLGAFARRAVKAGVDDNLAQLKRILELS